MLCYVCVLILTNVVCFVAIYATSLITVYPFWGWSFFLSFLGTVFFILSGDSLFCPFWGLIYSLSFTMQWAKLMNSFCLQNRLWAGQQSETCCVGSSGAAEVMVRSEW